MCFLLIKYAAITAGEREIPFSLQVSGVVSAHQWIRTFPFLDAHSINALVIGKMGRISTYLLSEMTILRV